MARINIVYLNLWLRLARDFVAQHRDKYENLMSWLNEFVCSFDLILYVPSIFQLNRDGSSWVKPVLS